MAKPIIRVPQVTLTRPTLADSEFLFRLRNHPQIRRWFRVGRVRRKEHDAWMRERCADPAPWFIGWNGGIRIGMVRLDGGEGQYDVSIAVHPDWRNRGVATVMLRKAVRGLSCQAFILRGNVASESLFHAAGFRCVGTEWRRG